MDYRNCCTQLMDHRLVVTWPSSWLALNNHITQQLGNQKNWLPPPLLCTPWVQASSVRETAIRILSICASTYTDTVFNMNVESYGATHAWCMYLKCTGHSSRHSYIYIWPYSRTGSWGLGGTSRTSSAIPCSYRLLEAAGHNCPYKPKFVSIYVYLLLFINIS